jgi:hypothetical protein
MSGKGRAVEDDVIEAVREDELASIIALLRDGAEVDDEHERLAPA